MIKLVASIKENLKHHFVKDVAILQVGNFAGTALAFFSSVIMARIFKPELYGQYSLVFSLLGLVGLFMNFGETEATTTLLSEAYQRKDRAEVLRIIAYYFKITCLVFLAIGVLGIILAPRLADIFYHQSIIGEWSRIMFLANFFLTGYAFLLLIFQVIRQIAKYAYLENVNKLITSLAIIFAVFFGLGVWGAIYVQLLVALIFLIFVYFYYQSLQRRETILPTYSEIIKEVFKLKIGRYFKFGFLIAVDKNLSNLRTLIPTLLIGYLLASANVAYYRIAFSYISLTVLFITPISNLLMVQFPKTKIYGQESLRKRFIQTSVLGGALSAVLAVFFVLIAPFLVKMFYGADYTAALPIINVLALNFALAGFGLGTGSMFRTINRMKVPIIIDGVSIGLSLPLAWWLINSSGLIGIAWWLVIVNNLLRFINYFYLINYLKRQSCPSN